MGGWEGIDLKHFKADQHPSLGGYEEIGESTSCQPETVLTEEGARQNVLNPKLKATSVERIPSERLQPSDRASLPTPIRESRRREWP